MTYFSPLLDPATFLCVFVIQNKTVGYIVQ